MKNYNKGFVVQGIIALVALLLLSGGAYIASKHNDSKISSSYDSQNNPNMVDSERTAEELNKSNPACKNGATNYPHCNADLPSVSDWKTYTNARNGYELKYPADWQIKENLGVSVIIFNPKRQGKPDTDQPSEGITISFKQTACVESSWKVGFGLINYGTACISGNNLKAQIDSAAFDEQGKNIEEKIISTIKFISVQTTNQNPSNNETNPYIGSITPVSAAIGTTLVIRGSGFRGFEGDVYFFFERADGKITRLPGSVSTQTSGDAVGAQTAQVLLKEPCQMGQTVYGDYSGKPSICDYVQMTPGVYKVYTQPWGKMSNKVDFTITGSNVSESTIFTHVDSGITFKYPKNWRFDAAKNYFTTSDYQEGKSGARIEFVYGLSYSDWQKTVAAMYGSKSTNSPISINGKPALQTTYSSEPYLLGLSMPFANNTVFVSLFLRYEATGRFEASYKESYEPILRQIAENMILPSLQDNTWHAYSNSKYNFSFNHPPLTSVVQSSTYSTNSVASYEVFVRYGFNQLLFVYSKPSDQSIKAWYDGIYSGVTPAKGPIEKTINGYSAIDVTFNDMANLTRHIMLAKGNVVIDFIFNADPDGPPNSDQQKLLDSFLFIN